MVEGRRKGGEESKVLLNFLVLGSKNLLTLTWFFGRGLLSGMRWDVVDWITGALGAARRGERGVLCGEEVGVLWRHFWCG